MTFSSAQYFSNRKDYLVFEDGLCGRVNELEGEVRQEVAKTLDAERRLAAVQAQYDQLKRDFSAQVSGRPEI